MLSALLHLLARPQLISCTQTQITGIFVSDVLLSPALTHQAHTPYQCCCAHTHSKGLFIPEWTEKPHGQRVQTCCSFISCFLLQEQGILSGPYVAQHPHFGTSKHHCCPGTERKTSPLPAKVSSTVDRFKRTHFFLTHCPHNASDFEATLPLYFPDPVPECDFSSFCSCSFLAHLIVLLVLIIWSWVVINISR